MNKDYTEPGDPAAFAPDFSKQPEPYGEPVPALLNCFAALPAGSHIVDIAGGYGRYALPLAQLGHTVTILDTHTPSLEEARRRSTQLSRGEIITQTADVLRNELPDLGRVDAVLCAGFIHHLIEPAVRTLFANMANGLHQGGLAVIEFSTDKRRRYPDGRPILVGGAPEQNLTHKEGAELVRSLYANEFDPVNLKAVQIKIRQPDFWYDTNMIIAAGTKR